MADGLVVKVTREGRSWVASIPEVDADGNDVVGPVKAASVADLVFKVHSEVASHAGHQVAIEFVWPWADEVAAAAYEIRTARAELDKAVAAMGEAVGNMVAAKVSVADIEKLTGMSRSEVLAVVQRRADRKAKR